jgi:hypothetical protein
MAKFRGTWIMVPVAMGALAACGSTSAGSPGAQVFVSPSCPSASLVSGVVNFAVPGGDADHHPRGHFSQQCQFPLLHVRLVHP